MGLLFKCLMSIASMVNIIPDDDIEVFLLCKKSSGKKLDKANTSCLVLEGVEEGSTEREELLMRRVNSGFSMST